MTATHHPDQGAGDPAAETQRPELTEAGAAPTPLHQALRWYRAALDREAEHGDVVEPSAMHLATVGAGGRPHVRVVFLRFLDDRGPGFVSDRGSVKAQDLAANPQVAGTVTWLPLFQAIHFRGVAEPMPDDELQAYWESRPYGAQMTSIAVDQSRPIDSRESLELRFAETVAANRGVETPERPSSFGGWRINCDEVEFFSGRPHRLHDRLVFRNPGGLGLSDPGWHVDRLMP